MLYNCYVVKVLGEILGATTGYSHISHHKTRTKGYRVHTNTHRQTDKVTWLHTCIVSHLQAQHKLAGPLGASGFTQKKKKKEDREIRVSNQPHHAQVTRK